MLHRLLAPGMVRLTPLLNSYSQSEQRTIHVLSFFVYLLTGVTFLGTIFLYNPDNVFGDTLISSPRNTVIRQTFAPGCLALSPYADSSTVFDPQGLNTPAQALLVSDDNVRVTIEDNETLTAFGPDIYTSGGTLVQQETFRTGDTFTYFSSGEGANVTRVLNVSISMVPSTPILLSGDPNECSDFFAGLVISNFDVDCFTGSTNSLNSFDQTFCALPTGSGVDHLELVINFPVTVRHTVTVEILDASAVRSSIGDFYCSSSGKFTLLRVAPFSCLEEAFRGWLEVLALSFSNSGLVYTFAVLVFSNFFYCQRSSKTERDMLKPV